MKYKDKSLEPVIMFFFWLLCFSIICIVGISNVFAASYDYNDFSATLYDNYGPELHYVLTTTVEGGGYTGTISSMTANTSGAAWGFSSPIPLVAGRTYSISINPGLYNATSDIVLSSYNRIGVGTTLSNAVTSYQNNTNAEEITSRSTGKYIQYVFKPTLNANFIVIPFATSSNISNASFALTNISLEDLGNSGVSESTINNSLNNQTNELNNSIQNSTDTIINNQNQNNEELKDTINENFNSCRDSYNLLYTPYTVDNKLTDTALRDDYFSSLNYYATLQAGKTYTFSVETDGQWGSSTGSDTVEVILLKGPNYNYFITMTSNPFTFIPQETGDFYIRYDINQNGKTHSFWNFQIVEGSSSKKWEQAGVQVCQNKIDETNDKLDNIQGAITDSSSPDTSGLENSAGWLPPGPLDSILNLPLTMLNSLTNSLGKTCSPLTLTLPYVNKNIEIPCLSSIFAQITGVDSLWTWVGTIASVLILYNYLLNLYAWVDRVLTLRAEFDEAMGADLANWGRL